MDFLFPPPPPSLGCTQPHTPAPPQSGLSRSLGTVVSQAMLRHSASRAGGGTNYTSQNFSRSWQRQSWAVFPPGGVQLSCQVNSFLALEMPSDSEPGTFRGPGMPTWALILVCPSLEKEVEVSFFSRLPASLLTLIHGSEGLGSYGSWRDQNMSSPSTHSHLFPLLSRGNPPTPIHPTPAQELLPNWQASCEPLCQTPGQI